MAVNIRCAPDPRYHSPVQILIDEAIPSRHLFAALGEVRPFPGRALTRDLLHDADALIVRSVTRVNAALLDAAPIRFVGTATTGLDHIDTAYLHHRGIRLAAAEGSNGRGVAEYVLAAILHLSQQWGGSPSGKTLGVIGRGRIGSLVADWASHCGMTVLACDPPLADSGAPNLHRFEDIAARCDLVTLHVPLTVAGPHPTQGMANRDWLARLRPGCILINSSRGEVIDEAALAAAVRSGSLAAPVLDVWQNEPRPDPKLVALAAVATPHVAGYTAESKLRAAQMLAAALADHVSSAADHVASGAPAGRLTPASPGRESSPTDAIAVAPGQPASSAAAHVLRHAVGLLTTDLAFREIVAAMDPAAFDALRARCAARREFPAYRVHGPLDPEARAILTRLGFP
ncbi:MAG: 4-phosphoerythronate dehydrogenase [Planctomycetia bacterium]|nr:4-phosphoerythronate dehydrogenase [Planctomycetia bacterium]